jgi:hypothetical protein
VYFLFSYSNYSVGDYPVLYPLANLDETCLSEEDLYTDDSSNSNKEDSGSGSESEDPTFVLNTSQMSFANNTQVSSFWPTVCQSIAQSPCTIKRPKP